MLECVGRVSFDLLGAVSFVHLIPGLLPEAKTVFKCHGRDAILTVEQVAHWPGAARWTDDAKVGNLPQINHIMRPHPNFRFRA
jgi:ABC-type antimicrobial peptide transport system permease subunit